MEDPTAWLVAWFVDQGFCEEPVEGGMLDQSYFEVTEIDSFDVVQLIPLIEETFDVTFTERHFQERRFVTIRGLAAIVAELVGARNGVGA